MTNIDTIIKVFKRDANNGVFNQDKICRLLNSIRTYADKRAFQYFLENYRPNGAAADTCIYYRCLFYAINGEYYKFLQLLKIKEIYNNKYILHIIGQTFEYTARYATMKKYYMMAIELGNKQSMCRLANYYLQVERNEAFMKIYYLKAANADAYLALGNFHRYDNPHLAINYYIKAADMGNTTAMLNVANYAYAQLEDTTNKLGILEKYFTKAIEYGDIRAMYEYGNFWQCSCGDINRMGYYFLLAISLMDPLHSKYNMYIYKTMIYRIKYYFSVAEQDIMHFIYRVRILTIILANKKNTIYIPPELFQYIIYNYL